MGASNSTATTIDAYSPAIETGAAARWDARLLVLDWELPSEHYDTVYVKAKGTKNSKSTGTLLQVVGFTVAYPN